jgi:MHS family proline/betaine transporter-like MFS transporter
MQQARASKITFLSSLGAALEYYDFMIYGLLVPILTPLFFTSGDSLTNFAKAFSIFALGYFARPLGGLIFGLIADRRGRRVAFTSTMFIMAFATCLIGLLPTAASIGSMAAWLLVVCRVLQGISFGAELPGAITVVSECNARSSRGLQCGFVISSTSVGAILATLMLSLITGILPEESIKEWGWRIPFLLGGILAVISLVLRQSMRETPAFEAIKMRQKKKRLLSPLFDALKRYPLSIMLGIGVTLLPAALIITNIYFASFLVTAYHYEARLVYQAMTIALMGAVLMVPAMGWIVDRWGKLILFMLAGIGLVISGPLLFSMLSIQTASALVAFLLLWQIFIAASIAAAFPLLTDIFPTFVRFTAMGICYNLAYLLGSLLPILYTHLMVKHNNYFVVLYSLMVAAGVSLSSALALWVRGYR